jgi:hypothetical protein
MGAVAPAHVERHEVNLNRGSLDGVAGVEPWPLARPTLIPEHRPTNTGLGRL